MILILFEESASNSSYLFDQLHPTFKCLFLLPLMLVSQLKYITSTHILVGSTDTKQITFINHFSSSSEIFLPGSISVFYYFLLSFIILCYSFRGRQHLSWSEILTVLWNFERIFWITALEIKSSLYSWLSALYSSRCLWTFSPRFQAKEECIDSM